MKVIKRFSSTSVLLITVSTATCIGADTTPAANASKADGSAAKLDAAFRLVQKAVADGEVPGAIALVAHRGKVVREEAYGLSDVENKVPFATDTICWIASITKAITAAAAMKLVDEGKLVLDAPVERYLPEFKAQTDKDGQHRTFTCRHLMSHTSGLLPDPPTRQPFFFEPGWLGQSIEDVVKTIANTTLQFSPGSKVLYSNAAFYVLGRVIEVVSGRPYVEYMQEAIFNPLGMEHAYFAIPASQAGHVAVVYRDMKDKRITFLRYDPKWRITNTSPEGGLFLYPRELAKFLQVFLDNDGRVLSKQSVQEMLTQQAPGWGLGWELENGTFSRGGSSGTSAWADLKTGTVGILFCQNQNRKEVWSLRDRFRQSIREAYGQPR